MPEQPWTPAEARYVADTERWTAQEGGYAHQQATKPTTLAAGLQDSPAGLAAWLGEKVVAWSGTDSRGEPAFDRDLLLATLTLYWTTRTITTSLLPYWAYRHQPGSALPADSQPPVPTAVSIFGGERTPFPKPPRELAERHYSVTAWAEHDRGGHFPAVATPQLLAQTLREVFRPLQARCRPCCELERDVEPHGIRRPRPHQITGYRTILRRCYLRPKSTCSPTAAVPADAIPLRDRIARTVRRDEAAGPAI